MRLVATRYALPPCRQGTGGWRLLVVGAVGFEILCAPDAFEGLRDAIVAASISTQVAEISLHPTVTVSLNIDTARSVLKLIGTIEDNDDVQRVSANFDISDEVMAELEKEL